MSTDGLMGPTKAAARFAELQERIDSYSPKTSPGSSFGSTLGGLLPADPSSFSANVTSTFGPVAEAAAAQNGLDPKIFKALVTTESGWNPTTTSKVGAQGLCQLMPSTAAELGVTNPMDPVQSIQGGAKYLKQMLDRFGGDYTKALAAYNAGPAAVEKANGVPPFQETIAYVRKIKQLAEATQ